MKSSFLVRLPILAAFMISMTSLIAAPPSASSSDTEGRVTCPSECQKDGCPLKAAPKDGEHPCEGFCAEHAQQHEREGKESCAKQAQNHEGDCDCACPHDRQEHPAGQDS